MQGAQTFRRQQSFS